MSAASSPLAPPEDLCALALRDPARALAEWQVGDWSRFLPQARSAGLLARAAQRVNRLRSTGPEALVGPELPAPLLGHLESSARMFEAQRREIRRELQHITRALAELDIPVILLKGAAYLAAGLPAAESRFFSDVDILVPKASLSAVESSLMLQGWLTTHQNDYDQRYYRQWMHELPPMQHVHRGTTLDVHHSIVPETARLRTDAARLIAASLPLSDFPGLRVLAPCDMVLHSMTHLFLNDDVSHALRDLSDLDLLLRHFAARDAGFWDGLVERAETLGLTRPLFYGLRYCGLVLDTPVPPRIQSTMSKHAPPPLVAALMHALWRRALVSPHPSAAPAGQALALLALYVRGHWLRMPPLLLARHLTIKALRLHERGQRQADAPPPPG